MGSLQDIPSPRRRSARPFLLPAASARSLSRFSSRSRISFSRWFLAAAPRIFLWLPAGAFVLWPASSSESAFGRRVLLSEGRDEESEPVRCLLVSSLRLILERNNHVSGGFGWVRLHVDSKLWGPKIGLVKRSLLFTIASAPFASSRANRRARSLPLL